MNTDQHLSVLNDGDLVDRYRASSDKRFVGELYNRYSHLVYGMCIQYFKDKDLAKDAVLEIFEKLFVELKRREVENFKGWLTFVVRNHCISELRKMQTQFSRNSEYSYEVRVEAASENKDVVEEEKKLEALEKAMNDLNPLQKTCIELFYLKDMSYSQIVDATGYSVNEVKSYIQNGKRNLKLMLIKTK